MVASGDNRKKTTASTRRLTFGLLTDGTESSYHVDILSGITDYARERDINLLVFVGGVFHSSDINMKRNKFYQLAHGENVDGLLVLTPTLGVNIGPDGMKKILLSLQPLPVVSLATCLPRITSVVIDNRGGMRDLLVHFIEEHGSRRFACVRGPARVADAEERFRVFEETMREFGIGVKPDAIVQGPYGANFGIKAVKILLDNRKAAFDTIIASNDDTAMGIIEELKRRGIAVPGDIRVAGFDDIIESRSFVPRLTTVHQPIYRIGRTACEVLSALINGKEAKLLTKLPTEAVIRESCGCTYAQRIKILHKKNYRIDFGATKASILRELGGLNLRFERGVQKPGRAVLKNIVESFHRDLVLKETGAFLKAWSDFLTVTRKQEFNFRVIHRVFYLLRERLFPFVHGYRNPSYLEHLCLKTEEMMENFFLEREMDKKIGNSDMEVKLRDLHEALHAVVDPVKQMETLRRALPAFGIDTCFLSLFSVSGKAAKNSSLMLAVRGGRRLEIAEERRRFASPPRLVPDRELLPLRERHTMIVGSLYYGEEQLGFALYDFIGWEPNPYEDLRMILSSSLKNALLAELMRRIEAGGAQSDELPVGIADQGDALAKSGILEIRSADLRIQRVLDFIREKYRTEITLKDGADRAFMAPTYFSKMFKLTTGYGFLDYLVAVRIGKACALLKNSGMKVSEIARSVGYPDTDYFYKVFKRSAGCTPSQYRERPQDTTRSAGVLLPGPY